MARVTVHLTLDDAVSAWAARFGVSAAQLVSRAVSQVCVPQRVVERWRSSGTPGVYEPVMGPESEASRSATRQHPLVRTIEVDDATHMLIRFAARLFGVSESEVVSRAVRLFSDQADEPATPAFDPWTPVDVYGEYDGHLVRAQYLPATRRLTVTTAPLAGRAFKSPSGAASAVVVALNPGRSTSPQTNGWRFWHLASTHERLEVLR